MFIELSILGIIGMVMTMLGFQVLGHCNSREGPVAIDVKKALEKGDFQLIARWISAEDEQELKDKFNKCRKIYQEEKGDKQEVAREYLMETTVRLHRAAEGMPFEGLQSVGSFPDDIEKGEQALEEENIESILNLLIEELQQEAKKWFQEAVEAKQTKNESIPEGRNYTSAYVKYITFVHKIYNEIKSGPPHGLG